MSWTRSNDSRSRKRKHCDSHHQSSSRLWNNINDFSVFRIKQHCFKDDNKTNTISEPETVGYFSIDSNRGYLANSSQLMYYNPSKMENVRFDLNNGIETVKRKPPSFHDENIGHLLEWIKLNYEKVQAPLSSERWIEPNIVCLRGLLKLIMCTPYDKKDPWTICAAKWKGTIYLCRYKTREEKDAEINMDANCLKFTYWGTKFEKYILSSDPDAKPDTRKIVDNSEEFCCMFKRRIGNHNILYGAEMDGVVSPKKLEDPLPLKDLKFIELKTCKSQSRSGERTWYHQNKLLNWWAQSYLVGIEEILCGFRNDAGIVSKLTTYSLPDITKKSKQQWNPDSCINFCETFLNHISESVIDDCDQTIYKFVRRSFGDIIMKKVAPDSEFAFIDPSYFEEMERKILERKKLHKLTKVEGKSAN